MYSAPDNLVDPPTRLQFLHGAMPSRTGASSGRMALENNREICATSIMLLALTSWL